MDIFPLEQVAEMLRRKRQRLGVKQKKAASLAGLSPSQVNRIERNSVNPGYDSIYSLYQALENLENQELETAAGLMHQGVEYVEEDEKVEEAIRKMRENDFSQLPVKRPGTGEITGRITERGIIESGNPDLEVAEVMGPELLSVNPDTSRSAVEEILKQEPAVLVKEDGILKGIITKSDLL